MLIMPTTCRFCDIAGIDLVQRTVTGIPVVAGGHGPLAVGHGRDEMDIRECARNLGRHSLRLCFELANSEKQGTGGCEDLCLCQLTELFGRSFGPSCSFRSGQGVEIGSNVISLILG